MLRRGCTSGLLQRFVHALWTCFSFCSDDYSPLRLKRPVLTSLCSDSPDPQMWHSVLLVLPVHPILIWTETMRKSFVGSLKETTISLRWCEPWEPQDHGIHFQHIQGSHMCTHSNTAHEYFARPTNRKVLTAPLPTTFSQFLGIRFVFRYHPFGRSVEHRALVPVTYSVIGPLCGYGADGSWRHRTGKVEGWVEGLGRDAVVWYTPLLS